MAQNDIDDVLDQLRRIKSGGDLSCVKIDQIEKLEMHLRFFRTFIKYHHVLLPNNSSYKMRRKAKRIIIMLYSVFGRIPDERETNLHVERLESQLLEFIECSTISRYNYELKDFDLPEYMDCLGKKLNYVLMCLEWGTFDHSLTIVEFRQINQFIKQLKIVQKKMRFLRYLYVSEINGYVDHEKLESLETQIQFMADNVGRLCFCFWVHRYEDEDDDNNLSKPQYLLGLIVLVELEMKKIFLGELKTSKFTQSRTFKDKKLPKGFSYYLRNLLLYLRNEKLKNFLTNVTARNIDVAIEFLLVFLGDVPNRVINGKRLNEVLEKIGILVGDILYVIKMLLAGSTIKEDASKIELGTIQILEKIEDLKAQVEEVYKSLQYSPSNEFPIVGGLSFLDSLQRKLNEMLKSESSFDCMMKPSIDILEEELSSLTLDFRDVAKVQHIHDEILNDLQRRTVNLAYEAEVSIDSILVQYNSLWHFYCSLPAITKEIKHIRAKVTEMRLQDLPLKPFSAIEPSKHPSTQHRYPVNDEEIVGFEIEEEKIMQYLINGTNKLDVIPIVGMGGQGKTTIARKVYNNEPTVFHFDCLAWCCISQTYNRIVLLKDICSQVASSKDDVAKAKDDKLADMLRKSLIHKRYLIVLDDMWDVTAWEDLMLSFPNDENGSRIIITTRLENVGKQVKYHSDPYYLPFLPLDESCKLLEKKVFQQEGCPPELEDLSLQIAEKCKGLPLVIILVAGIIKRNKMEASWWHEVKNSLLSYLGESEGYSVSTMQLSYDNLPDHLRPCLLYMGIFPEDAIITVSQLISLWIAEGFVQNTESGRSMEEAAEGYLMDLIRSNMVMVSRRRYNGKVKYCQVHDIVLHFCLEKSREERFMLAVKDQFQPYDWNRSRVSFSFSEEDSMFASPSPKTRNPFHQHLRSLIMTSPVGSYRWNPFLQCVKLRFLKVLHLSSRGVGPLSSATLKPLVHLKYLAVQPHEFHFHHEPHLLHLETLILVGLFKPTALPAIFLKMEKLRHVEISKAVFDWENYTPWIFEESSKLENLKILRKIKFPIDEADRLDVLLRRCPNLQELEISFKGNGDSPGICLKLESLLTQLQILRLSFKCPKVVSSELQLPSNLKKLVLTGNTHIESTISFIAGLPSLEYLQLWDFTQLKEWFLPTDITFHKLKVLKLGDCRISRWDASEESFPLLEILIIERCNHLEEIPFSFAYIPTLKQIRLFRYKQKSLEASAVRILEEVENIEGSDRLQILIMYHSFF
ncbi:hypothetical protein HAX54_053286 [Datura stramonium]|uniref:NB-ARC domain-containing protein n=1 Tax=Datura stramonium TaxID=4076 RepID=A0ABS8T061_DATST|nr:hypothetical protein [Datura stramonium]